ncbi:hypothetical protein ARMGADRAFT_297586 [Armillaria gallica]|uniref:Uncharacterized protein n=1 Tax=Armillaria gallica TaxID=47427 RepID=A0A2H3DSJ0_ARMGA|nr:hypothetical protein ARMGADRAFT_297586 [Armillaria gallica]
MNGRHRICSGVHIIRTRKTQQISCVVRNPSTMPSSFFFLAPVDLEAEIFVRRESWMPRTFTLFHNLRIPPRSRFSKCWVCSLQYALPFGHHHGTRVLRSLDAQILESVEADLAESGPSITPKTNTLALVDDLPAPSNTEALPDPVCEFAHPPLRNLLQVFRFEFLASIILKAQYDSSMQICISPGLLVVSFNHIPWVRYLKSCPQSSRPVQCPNCTRTAIMSKARVAHES